MQRQQSRRMNRQTSEQGFMLLGLIVAIAVILLVLGAAASATAFSLRRERELESARRADQYVRAIRRFYLKNGHYPVSIEQLENTNNVRYLRQRYVDPLTGKADYRLILVGKNKTSVKGFFGEPLAGLASTGLGSAAGMQSAGVPGPGNPGGTAGAAAGVTAGSPATGGAPSLGSAPVAVGTGLGSTPSPTGLGGTSPAPGSAGTAAAAGATDNSGISGSAGPFMGVGSSAVGNSLITVNGQTTYDTWEFLYDPRLESLRQAGAANAGANSIGAGSLGTTPGAPGTTNGLTPGPTGTPPGTGVVPVNGATPQQP